MTGAPVRVRQYNRRAPQVPTKYLRRTPPSQDRDILSSRIDDLQDALDRRVGAFGDKKGIPITEEQIRGMEEASKITQEEHDVFQDTQAWAHASGIISLTEASVIYRSLGEVGSAQNGGWARGTKLGAKITVQKIVAELLGMKIAESRRGR
jgi:hypothetical protein